MVVRLSSKGQLVIPKIVREALGLEAGAELRLGLDNGRIVLESLSAAPATSLYGRFAGVNFLDDLEAEHRQEVASDNAPGA